MLTNLDLIDSETGAHITTLLGQSGITIRELYCPVDKRRRGGASRILQTMCYLADKEGKLLIVYPVPDIDCNMTLGELITFYESFGFRLDDSLDRDDDLPCMIRTPKLHSERLS